MKWQKRFCVLVVVLLLALLLATPAMAAPPARIASDGFWFPSMFGSPEQIWFPGQDGIQSRGRWQGMMVFSGDPRIAGDWVFYFDEHFDRDWSGHWNGTFHAEVRTAEGRGAWDGQFHGECYGLWDGSGSVIYGSGKGSGALAGARLKIEFVDEGFGQNYIAATIQ